MRDERTFKVGDKVRVRPCQGTGDGPNEVKSGEVYTIVGFKGTDAKEQRGDAGGILLDGIDPSTNWFGGWRFELVPEPEPEPETWITWGDRAPTAADYPILWKYELDHHTIWIVADERGIERSHNVWVPLGKPLPVAPKPKVVQVTIEVDLENQANITAVKTGHWGTPMFKDLCSAVYEEIGDGS